MFSGACLTSAGWWATATSVYAPLIAGATTLFREGSHRLTPHPSIASTEIIEKYGVSVIFTAPTAVQDADARGRKTTSRQYATCGALRLLTCAGEPLNPEALRTGAFKHICGDGEWGLHGR